MSLKSDILFIISTIPEVNIEWQPVSQEDTEKMISQQSTTIMSEAKQGMEEEVKSHSNSSVINEKFVK